MSRWRRDGPMTRGRASRAYANPGIVAKFARDLQSGRQPIELLGGRPACRASAGSGLPRRYVGHPLGVFVGQLEEQRVLVPEVVEDRAARQPDGLLEPAHGGLVGAVLGKARRAPSRIWRRRAARWLSLTRGNGAPYSLRPASRASACCAARIAGCRRCGSSRPHRGCRCAPPRRTRRRCRSPWWP
jgi:hypothetical protein